MARKLSQKKTETLDVRVSHDEKVAFMEAVNLRGKTASIVIRDAMHLFVQNGRLRRRNIMISTLLAAAASLSTFALLVPDGETDSVAGLAEFTQIDTNLDRQLTLEEFQTHLGSVLTAQRLDAAPHRLGRALGILWVQYDVVPPQEFFDTIETEPDNISESCQQAMQAAWDNYGENAFHGVDANSDGQISFTEFSPPRVDSLGQTFDRLDIDQDGYLTESEVIPQNSTARSDDQTTTPDDRAAHIEICLGEQPRAASSVEVSAEGRQQTLRFLDLDADGVVSRSEYINAGG